MDKNIGKVIEVNEKLAIVLKKSDINIMSGCQEYVALSGKEKICVHKCDKDWGEHIMIIYPHIYSNDS